MNEQLSTLADILRRAIQAIEIGKQQPGDEFHAGMRLRSLYDRLARNRLQLAVLGQVKRGKSTFINALLGAPVLPASVIPLTAVPIFISEGTEPRGVVRFAQRRPPEELCSTDPGALQAFLARFVAEENNPQNHLNVARVELEYPASILEDGTVLIDTPGIGSPHTHNTDVAFETLPECDAALFVVSADPPITEVELAYLERIKLSAAKLFIVLNKLDYFEPPDRQLAADFLDETLERHGIAPSDRRIFGISARDALIAKHNGDRAALERSGLEQIERQLLRFLATDKTSALVNAITAKAANLISETIAIYEIRIKTLTLPIDQLEATAHAFQMALHEVEEQRLRLRDLLAGDKRRLIEKLASDIQELRNQVSAEARPGIEKVLSTAPPDKWQSEVRRSTSGVLESLFDAASTRLINEHSEALNEALKAYRLRLAELTNAVHREASNLFAVELPTFREDVAFELPQSPYWITEPFALRLIPETGRLLERFLPLPARRVRARERFIRVMDDLILRSAENLRWAILRGIAETALQAAAELEQQLDEVITAIEGMIESALRRRRHDSSKADADIRDLERVVGELHPLRAELIGHPDVTAKL